MVILKETSRDWILVAVIALTALGANMPSGIAEYVNIDRRFFLAGLIAFIAVALVRYLKFTLLLVVVFLAIGANLPENVAAEFGVDSQILLLALIVMVVVSFSNRLFKLPVGMERTGRSKSAHGAAALFTAVLKGRIASVQALLGQGVNVNCQTVSGKTPLMAAAYKGYSDIVQLLVSNGADINAKDHSGNTAVRMAERNGFTRIVDLLKHSGAEAA